MLWALRIQKEELARIAQEKQAQEEAALQEMEELKRVEEEELQRLAEKDRIQREQEEQEKQAELQLQVGGLCKASSGGGVLSLKYTHTDARTLSHSVHPGNWELQCNLKRQWLSEVWAFPLGWCDSNTGPKLRMGSFSCITLSFAATTSFP